MFERFTESSRRVVVLAQEEARMYNHNYIGSEHILLGLIHEGDGLAARAIVSLGLTLELARDQVRELIGPGQETPSGHIPFTPRAKKVLELSLREALALKKEYIGTEHILLGLAREGNGVGAQILDASITLAAVRERVLSLAADEPAEPAADEQLAVEWLGSGPQAGPAGLRRPGRVVIQARMITEFRETLATIGETLAGLEQRLAGIERQLGITPPAPEEGAEEGAEGPDESAQTPPAPEEGAPGPAEGDQAPDRTAAPPQDDSPTESAG